MTQEVRQTKTYCCLKSSELAPDRSSETQKKGKGKSDLVCEAINSGGISGTYLNARSHEFGGPLMDTRV